MEIQDSFVSKIKEKTEEMVFTEIKRIGIEVDKEELIKALQYDRQQYEKGYSDGYAKGIDKFAERLKAEHEGLITNLGKPYAITFEKIDEIAEEMKVGAE